MSYIEGADYWVRLVSFPNMGSPAVTASHGAVTFTIYVNARFSPERQREGLRHELEHINAGHFYRDDVELAELEAAADGIISLAPPEKGPQPVSGGRSIPFYQSMGELLEDFIRRASPGSLKLLRREGFLPEETKP